MTKIQDRRKRHMIGYESHEEREKGAAKKIMRLIYSLKEVNKSYRRLDRDIRYPTASNGFAPPMVWWSPGISTITRTTC